MTDELHELSPDWTMAPAATLRDWMTEHGVSPNLLALWCGTGVQAQAELLISDVLSRKPLLQPHAEMLELGTRIPARSWLNRERDYRADLAAGRKDVTPEE